MNADDKTQKNKEIFDSCLEHLAHLQTASELLKDLYYEVGPYADRKEIRDSKTWDRIKNYFRFDDSE